jgi:hypothetical protein
MSKCHKRTNTKPFREKKYLVRQPQKHFERKQNLFSETTSSEQVCYLHLRCSEQKQLIQIQHNLSFFFRFTFCFFEREKKNIVPKRCLVFAEMIYALRSSRFNCDEIVFLSFVFTVRVKEVGEASNERNDTYQNEWVCHK